jgi:hypothetical protein
MSTRIEVCCFMAALYFLVRGKGRDYDDYLREVAVLL